MESRTLVFVLFALTSQLSLAQPRLSDQAQISLLTVAPGTMLYSLFGHSALRVYDPVLNLDRCYNYGTFNFDEPNFLLNFCRGRLYYYLDTEPYRYLEYAYLQEGRPFQEQILNLNAQQRQFLFELLEENAREENRYYLYDFFYDNCATRIRDVVEKALFYQITFDTAFLPLGKTMRELLHPYLANRLWTRFGIDLALGQPADRVALARDFMFLPDYMRDMFARARLADTLPLVAEERHQLQWLLPSEANEALGFFRNPMWVMCLIAAVGVATMFSRRAEQVFDVVFWFVLGLAGLILSLLWFATDHASTKNNWNLLWALPTHLLFFWRIKRTELTETYFTAVGALALLTLILWGFLPQNLPEAALPIVVLVVVKGLARRYFRETNS
ncbi:MAG: DUF4105 domain-containing protein [Saprospiraceae bacterium]|nr:DUF4105 domain-containing protein [Saprospiraceae bacterium]MDW8483920.1 DUF4105 domain-containing protein [Saprospiraceae bacterium]